MPKSSKKRKDKAADFAKAKLKLGKGKQAPSNAIDTSFKARSIALPTQSITVEKDENAPTTRRKQTLEDLISHLKHHNAAMRKDAILGLKELCLNHPEVLSSFPALVNSTVRLISDEDSSVRKALISLFATLLPQVPPEDVLPHASLFLLYTSSAQTHIFPEIRIDAVRFLNLLLNCIPEAVVSGWDSTTGAAVGGTNNHGTRILAGYLGILNAGTIYNDVDTPTATSTATVMLTIQSKLVILQSLAAFLKVALKTSSSLEATAESSDDAWFLAPSFTSPHAYSAFNRPLRISRDGGLREWHQVVDITEDSFEGNFPFTETRAGGWGMDLDVELIEGSEDGVRILVSKLATALHSTLTSIFIDCSATVFSPSNSPPETDLLLILAVLAIVGSLYGWLFERGDVPTSATEELSALLSSMASFFPFKPYGRMDARVERSFQEMSIQYCSLTSHLVLAQSKPTSSHPSSRAKKQQKQAIQIDHVREYVLELLSSSDRPLNLSAYTSLLPTIWALVNVASDGSNNMFQAVIEHSTRLSSKGAPKRRSLEFVSKLILLDTDPHYRGGFKASSVRGKEESSTLDEWMAHLPKVLWELGAGNLGTSEVILLLLNRMLQRKLPQAHNPRTLSALQAKMVPYFLITHPEKGRISGPYAKLPPFVSSDVCARRLVLDMSALLLAATNPNPETQQLRQSIQCAVVQNSLEEKYWTQLMLHVCSES